MGSKRSKFFIRIMAGFLALLMVGSAVYALFINLL